MQKAPIISNPPLAGENKSKWDITLSEHILDIFILMVTPIFFIAYGVNVPFRTFIDNNLAVISRSLDLSILLVLLVYVPFALYWVMFILRVIGHFWTSFATFKIRVYFRIFRVNFSIYGIISIVLAYWNKVPILTWWVIFAGIAGILVGNLFFITYKPVWKQESAPGAEDKVSFTLLQPILIFSTFILLIFYLSDTPVTGAIDDFFLFVNQDIAFMIVFWVTIVFVMLWFVVSFIGMCIMSLVSRKKTHLSYLGKILIIGLYIYFVIKLLVQNLPYFIPPEYVSVTSMAFSFMGSFSTMGIKKLIEWKLKKK